MRQPRRKSDYERFQDLTFDQFRKLAGDRKLTSYEKIGFPPEYRRGYEKFIFEDIISKLGSLRKKAKLIADIGCGCSGLAFKIINQCKLNRSTLLLVDSEEMLSQLPDRPFIEKFSCCFPQCPELMEKYAGKVDGIIVYSVLQHVFLEANIFDFIDASCRLLRAGGEIMIGDIPNVSMRNRFFYSENGLRYHHKFTGGKVGNTDHLIRSQEKRIDDGVIFGILQRYRNFGFHTYLLPQPDRLPMANRREDIIIRKP